MGQFHFLISRQNNYVGDLRVFIKTTEKITKNVAQHPLKDGVIRCTKCDRGGSWSSQSSKTYF